MFVLYKTNRMICLITVCAIMLIASPLFAASVVGSKHDFSASATASPFAGSFTMFNAATGFDDPIDEVCVFCHTPHGSSKNVSGASGPETGPLWNRTNSPPGGFSYSMYASSTLNATISAAPTGSSAMCMSCHDGVTSIAVNALLNAPGPGNEAIKWISDPEIGAIGDIYYPGAFAGDWGPNLGENYPGMGNTTIDLSNDHPVSFNWPTDLDAGLRDTTLIDSALRLFGANKRLECATCHQVHDPANVPFLAMSNSGSAMCLECHIK